jgi:putative tricarboxylic transport membrane protein
MRLLSFIPSVVLTALGIAFCIFSLGLGLGNVHAPGPGFVPFLAGGLLVVLTIAALIESRPEIKVKTWSGLFGGDRWRVVLGVLGSLFLYALVMERVGFMISTFLILLFLFKIPEGQRWRTALAASVLTMVLTYFLFEYFLRISFPRGFLGS